MPRNTPGTDAGAPAVVAVERLRLTLEGVAAALGGARLDELLATEEQLVAALSGLSELAGAQEAIVSPALRAELTLARAALDSCRQLGAVVRQVCDACVIAQGRGGEYLGRFFHGVRGPWRRRASEDVMSLLSGLTAIAGSLDAQRYGLTVAGQNIANLNTEGYVRRSALLTEVMPGSGGGVQATGVQAHRDTFIEARLRAEMLPEQRAGALADSLAVVGASLGTAGASVDHDLTAFFDAFATLAQDPTSATARQGVLLNGGLLAQGFHDVSLRLDDSARAADAQVRDAVTEINTLASKIAQLNGAIGSTAGADAETLKDQLGVALKSLAGLTTTAVLTRADGGIDVTIAGGRPIVIGDKSYALGVTSVGPGGLASVTIGGTNVTSQLTDGKIGGLLYARDTLIPGYKTQLDQLAFAVTQQVNTAHQAGFDLNGTPGTAFFTPLAAAPGAAAAFGVNPGIAADARLIAASGTVGIGGNETAQAIAALRDARLAGGGTSTFTQAWSQLVYQVGSDAQTALAAQKSRQAIVSTLTRLRDSVSGVSLDEEAGTMLKFQRAYEANAKYFTVVSDVLDTLMGMVR